MASGDGVCAGEAQTENRSMLAMTKRRLDMGSSDDGSRDDRVTVAALHEFVYATFRTPAEVALARIHLSAVGVALRPICRFRRNTDAFPS
jgi:hypothetical protein